MCWSIRSPAHAKTDTLPATREKRYICIACFALCGSSYLSSQRTATDQHLYNRIHSDRNAKQTNEIKLMKRSECAQIPLALDRVNCYGLVSQTLYALTRMAHSFCLQKKVMNVRCCIVGGIVCAGARSLFYSLCTRSIDSVRILDTLCIRRR